MKCLPLTFRVDLVYLTIYNANTGIVVAIHCWNEFHLCFIVVKSCFFINWCFLLNWIFVGSFYLPFNILLIAFFNYYYTFLQLDPDDVSEQLKRQGASIPLVRPGRSTATFIKTVISSFSSFALYDFLLIITCLCSLKNILYTNKR